MTDVSGMIARESALAVQPIRPVLVFGRFEADENSFELRRDGEPVLLSRQVLEVIFFMLKSRGRLVTFHDLTQGPWRGTVVSHAAISRAIMLARRALSAEPHGERGSIVTVHGKGYRFVGSIREIEEAATSTINAATEGPAERDHRPRARANERFCSMGDRPRTVGVGCRANSCWHPASGGAP